jgi:hypothetical protein
MVPAYRQVRLSRFALQGSTGCLSIVFWVEKGWSTTTKVSVSLKVKYTELTAARTRYSGPAFGFTKLRDGTIKRFKLIASVYVPSIVIEVILGLLKVSLKA